MKYVLLILVSIMISQFNITSLLKKEKEIVIHQLTASGNHINYIFKFDLEGKLKSLENPYEKVMLANQGKSGKVITRFKYNLNGKLKEEIRKRETSTIEEEIRFRRSFEYDKEDKLKWESYTIANDERDIRTKTYFYDEDGLLEKIKEENIEDKNRHTTYKYNYTENKIFESISMKTDTSTVEITYNEDDSEILIAGYEINDNQSKKLYSTFYKKNDEDQFTEYKFINEKDSVSRTESVFIYAKNKMLEKIETDYKKKEHPFKFVNTFKCKNKKQFKNLKKDTIIKINKKLIETNCSAQIIWKLANTVQQ